MQLTICSWFCVPLLYITYLFRNYIHIYSMQWHIVYKVRKTKHIYTTSENHIQLRHIYSINRLYLLYQNSSWDYYPYSRITWMVALWCVSMENIPNFLPLFTWLSVNIMLSYFLTNQLVLNGPVFFTFTIIVDSAFMDLHGCIMIHMSLCPTILKIIYLRRCV